MNMKRKTFNTKKKKIVVVLSCVCALLIFIGIRYAVLAVLDGGGAVTDLSQYSTERNTFFRPNLVAHFPQTIPGNATDVRMSTHPGFREGGHFQLHTVMPSSIVQSMTQQYSQSAVAIYSGGGSINTNGPIPTTFFHTSQNGPEEFSIDFTFYILGFNQAGPPDSPWSDSDAWGVAINPVTNQVVYWAQVG